MEKRASKIVLCISILIAFVGCSEKMKSVSVAEFSEFVSKTNYQTDAERFGWSFVQQDVYTVDTIHGSNWRMPDGRHASRASDPVTQVSYSDAIAFCKWAECRLPTYNEYWDKAKNDNRPINIESKHIESVQHCALIGNVWELCRADSLGYTRLAGGSFLCSKSSCDGSSRERMLRVDRTTANSHIGFAVIR